MPLRAARTAWLIALLLYAAAAAGDAAWHLREGHAAGAARFAPDRLAVALSACLFWPVDLVAQVLFPEA